MAKHAPNIPEAVEVFDDANSWAETGKHWPRDMMLREAGFAIHKRPADGVTIWTRHGKFYTQGSAESIARRELGK